jgi:hypothetical protein
MICHQPFVCDDTCSCSPSHNELLLRNAEINERFRERQRKADRLLLVQVFVVISVASFCSLYAVAAFVDQANSNLKSWVASHEPV